MFMAFALVYRLRFSAAGQQVSRRTDAEARRQDVMLIAYLLGAILIMLGLIADRIH